MPYILGSVLLGVYGFVKGTQLTRDIKTNVPAQNNGISLFSFVLGAGGLFASFWLFKKVF